MKLTYVVIALFALYPLSGHAQGRDIDPLPLARIRPVIRAHQRQINACYVNQHRVRPRMPPHIDITFTIGGDGRVRSVDFPLPLFPSKTTNSPGGMARSASWRTTLRRSPSGNDLLTFWSSIRRS